MLWHAGESNKFFRGSQWENTDLTNFRFLQSEVEDQNTNSHHTIPTMGVLPSVPTVGATSGYTIP